MNRVTFIAINLLMLKILDQNKLKMFVTMEIYELNEFVWVNFEKLCQ